MTTTLIQTLKDMSIASSLLDKRDYLKLLQSQEVPLLSLLDAAYQIRKSVWGNAVQLHVINNIQNGFCPEDCSYCAQAKPSDTEIVDYPIKDKDQIIEEAKRAHERGAFRYCMVSSGRGPSKHRIQFFADVIKKIKKEIPIEVCLSAGLVDKDGAKALKEAGLDRLNHNLNTTEKNYPKICSTHTYHDRMKTLSAAQSAGLTLCSGAIIGMGETDEDIIDLAIQFRSLKVTSIPINFFLPLEGTQLPPTQSLTPEYCLRVLCLFRFINPKAELRIAAGREYHLRSLQPLGLYPCNSLFFEGYLNSKGSQVTETLQMIKDSGFDIDTTHDVADLLQSLSDSELNKTSAVPLKTKKDLHPSRS